MIEMLGVPSASSFADDIDMVFSVIFWIVLFWFLLAEGSSSLPDRPLPQEGRRRRAVHHRELKSEKRWITIPHNLILVFDVIIVIAAVKVWYTVKQDLPDAPDKQIVRVVAQQWAWTFVHPVRTGSSTRPTTSPRSTSFTYRWTACTTSSSSRRTCCTASPCRCSAQAGRHPRSRHHGLVHALTKTGEYDIQCTEICGVGHALMPARIYIETADQHAAWVASNSSVSVASATVR